LIMVRHGNKPGPRPCSGRTWRRLQAIVFETFTHCWICGQWVDQELRTGPEQRTVDHAIPQALWPEGALILDNLRLAHMGCNSGRGKRLSPRAKATTSRTW